MNWIKFGILVLVSSIPMFALFWILTSSSQEHISARIIFVNYNSPLSPVGQNLVMTLGDTPNSTVIINRTNLNLNQGTLYPNQIVLECSATFPVKWSYEGSGIPQGDIIMSRSSDTFSMRWILNPIWEKTTGKYICSSVQKNENENSNSNNESFNEKLNVLLLGPVHYFLFVPGNRTFVSSSDQEVKITSSDSLTIPCSVSDPTMDISLYMIDQKDEWHIEVTNGSSYDPKIGFTLSPSFVNKNISNIWGTYFCKDGNGKKSPIVNVLPNPEKFVRISPSQSPVNLANSSFDGTFTCEAKENVSFQFSKVTRLRKVFYSTNSSSSFPFITKTRFQPKDLQATSTVSCRTKTGITLHTWKFIESDEVDNFRFYFDGVKQEFSCCIKPFKLNPEMILINCSSPAECDIFKTCIKTSSCKSSLSTIRDRTGCIQFKPDLRNGPIHGMLYCYFRDLNQDLLFFINGNGNRNNSYVSLAKTWEEMTTNNSKNILYIKSQGVIQLAENSVKTTRVILECFGSKMFITSGFMWFLEDSDGTTMDVDGAEYFDNNYYYSRIEVDESTNIKIVHCRAPIHNSKEWATANFSNIADLN